MIDIMGNYTGYDDSLDTEEERKRKERLAAEKATPVKQTITTDPTTGAQNVKIEGSAYNLSSANPNTPTVSGPAIPSNAQYLAQNESGNNPNIGFHNPAASSAYGTYGITAPQYQEIQKANPAFANRPITSLNPQEQTAALGTSNDVYTRQLQAKGIPEVTPGMVNAAHLTGAGGLHQFLTQGTVNPALAAQNGGEDAFRQNILNRLASQPSPASGAAPQTMPAPPTQPLTEQPQPVAPTPAASLGGQNFLQANQTAIAGGAQPGPGTPMSNNPFLALTATAPTIPKENQMYADFLKNQDNLRGIDQVEATHAQQMPSWLKSVVNDQRYSLMDNDVKKYQAEKEVKALQEQGNTTALGRILAEKSRETGSWPKAILYGLIGATGPAQEELAKLGYGKRWQEVRLDDGRALAGEFRRDGIPLQGYDIATGKKLTQDELGQLMTGTSTKNTDISMTPHQALVDGELHTFSTRRTSQGLQYRDDTIGSGWTNKAPEGLTHLGQVNPQEQQGLKTKQQIESKMRKANADALAVGGKPLYTEEQITNEGNQGYTSLTGKAFGGAPTTSVSTTAAPAPAASVAPAPAAASKPKSQAQAILDYEMPPPVGPTTPAKSALLNEVQRLASEQGKTYDGAQYKIAAKTRQDFTTGQQGKAVQAMNVAIDHLDTLQGAANALNNHQLPIFNDIAQKFAKNTGQSAPTDFNALKSIVGSEIAKAVTGGASALGDREEIRAEINSKNSPEQLAGVIAKYQQLMAGQVKGLKQTYEGAGLKGFDEKLLPRTKFVLNSTQEPSRSKW